MVHSLLLLEMLQPLHFKKKTYVTGHLKDRQIIRLRTRTRPVSLLPRLAVDLEATLMRIP